MTPRPSPFLLMLIFFSGLAISLSYGLLAAAVLWLFEDRTEAQVFFANYVDTFRTVISLGLIIGTAMIVRRMQAFVPEVIERSFTRKQLQGTDYEYYKERFSSRRISITFMSQFIVIGWVIYYFCHFPNSDLAQNIMLVAICTEYALGVYVGRKLIYTGLMLHSLLSIKLNRNLFKDRKLDEINWYVNVASTLTIIFVYVHVVGYHAAPFLYDRLLGNSIKIFILLPAVIAAPVLLIFNFYPRAVLQKIYNASIDVELRNLQRKLKDEGFTEFEKKSYLIEFDKMSRDQLRYSLRLELTDIPIGITILVMVLQPLLKP